MSNKFIRRGISGAVGLCLVVAALVGASAGVAGAVDTTTTWATTTTAATTTTVSDGTGYVEICKVFTPPATTLPGFNLAPVFSFSISGDGNSRTVSVQAGTCSPEIAVNAGSGVTITETLASWYKVTSITELAGQSYINSGSINLGAGSVVVTVTPGAGVDAVTYTNAPVTGYVEVCKAAVSGSGLTGTYNFAVTGANGFSTTTGPVSVGDCSDPILVPAGTVNAAESGTNLYVTGITAQVNGVGASQIVTDNLTAGTVTANVGASALDSTQTDITYTNDVVSFKLCKAWDSETTEPGGASTLFGFTFSASGPVGPNAAPPSASIEAGQCTNPVALRPGTIITATEGIVPGTKLESVTSAGAESIVPGSVSITGLTAQVIVGTPTTSSSAPTDEAILTFTDEAAAPGELKICKFAGTNPGPPVGTAFNFTVSGDPGVTTTVSIGNCALVLNSSGQTATFPYNSTQVVTEAASANNAASAISATPTYVSEIVAGTPTNTAELVNGPTTGIMASNTAASESVTIGESDLTEVSFTDVDPPATTTSPVTAPIVGGPNFGIVTAPTAAEAAAVANSPAIEAAAASVANTNTTGGIKTVAPKLTKAQKAALLKKDKALLKSLDKSIVAQQHRVANTKGAAHKAAEKTLFNLKARAHVLQLEISLLK